MKRTVKIAGVLLMLLFAFNLSLSAQRGMRGMKDPGRMNRMWMGADTVQMYKHGMLSDSLRMRQMHGMKPGHMYGRGPMMAHNRFYDMRGGFGPRERMGKESVGIGRLMLESIPNVTEKQKKEISDLRTKQQEEMKKLREEMSSKMQSLRESHRKSLLNILTDEQKKYIDSKQPKTNSVPAKTN